MYSRDKISRESSHWLNLLPGGWEMPSLSLIQRSAQTQTRVLVEWFSAAHKPSDFSPTLLRQHIYLILPGPLNQLELGSQVTQSFIKETRWIQLAERSWAVDLSAREAECAHAGMCCMFTWWRRALIPWGITANRPCKCHVQCTVLEKGKQRKWGLLSWKYHPRVIYKFFLHFGSFFSVQLSLL